MRWSRPPQLECPGWAGLMGASSGSVSRPAVGGQAAAAHRHPLGRRPRKVELGGRSESGAGDLSGPGARAGNARGALRYWDGAERRCMLTGQHGEAPTIRSGDEWSWECNGGGQARTWVWAHQRQRVRGRIGAPCSLRAPGSARKWCGLGRRGWEGWKREGERARWRHAAA